MPEAAAHINTDAFHLQMYRAEREAARQGFPVCPTTHNERVIVGDVVYAVNWTSRGGASRTMKLDALVTNLSTGRSMGIEGVIRKGGTQFCLPRKGTWTGRAAAALALAEIAAPHTQALVLWNPVSGPAFVGVSA